MIRADDANDDVRLYRLDEILGGGENLTAALAVTAGREECLEVQLVAIPAFPGV